MRRYFILTAIGKDRPGIVADLAEMAFDLGCNLGDSSMMNLAGEFSTMILISGQGEELDERLSMAAKHLEYEKGMTIFIRPVGQGASPASPPGARRYRLHTMGEDKAGIVARTARLIASVGGNVLELNSHVRRAATTGTPLYEMDMSFDLPPSVDIEALRRKMEEIENALNIEVDLNLV